MKEKNCITSLKREPITVPLKDDFSAKGAHIIFRPGIDLTEMIKTQTFKKKTAGKVVAKNELPGENTGDKMILMNNLSTNGNIFENIRYLLAYI